MFDTPEAEIVKPYGAWMRAPFRKPVKQIGARWLRDGGTQVETKSTNQETGENHGGKFATENPADSDKGGKSGAEKMQSNVKGASHGFSNLSSSTEGADANTKKKDINVIESKKRRTDDGLGKDKIMGLDTEIGMDSDSEDVVNMDQDTSSKNGKVAGFQGGARLAL